MFKINQVLCPGRVSHFLGTSWQFSSISMGEGRKKSLKKSDYKKELVIRTTKLQKKKLIMSYQMVLNTKVSV